MERVEWFMDKNYKMTVKEFLDRISYSTAKDKMFVYYENEIINYISFEGVEEKLEDDEYCSNLAEEVALQSSYAENLIEY